MSFNCPLIDTSDIEELTIINEQILFSDSIKEKEDNVTLSNIFKDAKKEDSLKEKSILKENSAQLSTNKSNNENSSKEEVSPISPKEYFPILKENIIQPNSLLLFENVNNKNKTESLKRISPKKNKSFLINNVKENLKTIQGSVKLQECLPKLSEKEKHKIFIQIIQSLEEITCSEYGNYFFSKFIFYLSEKQRALLLLKAQSIFIQIATNKFGTHSMQALLRNLETESEINYFMNLIQSHLLQLIYDENGYHLIIEFMMFISEEDRTIFNDFIISNIYPLSQNKTGNEIIKKFINFNKNKSIRSKIIYVLQINLYNMIYNSLSNTVLIYALKIFGVVQCNFILNQIKLNLIPILNIGQIGYSFIEKLLIYLSKNDILIFSELSNILFENNILFHSLISNVYGISLLKTAFNCSPVLLKNKYIMKIPSYKC